MSVEVMWALVVGLGACVLASIGVIVVGVVRIRDARAELQSRTLDDLRPRRMNAYNATLFRSGWRTVSRGIVLCIASACLFTVAVVYMVSA